MPFNFEDMFFSNETPYYHHPKLSFRVNLFILVLVERLYTSSIFFDKLSDKSISFHFF